MTVRVYVDGSGLATGGPGGIGYVIPALRVEGSLELSSATNQQAEILAAAYALHQLDPCPSVHVVSDSQYLVRGWERLPAWIARGWRIMSGPPVANQAHWRRLQAAAARHGRVEFEWCKGHAGTAANERADELAGAARARAKAAA
jgi:ribonuclease HI